MKYTKFPLEGSDRLMEYTDIDLADVDVDESYLYTRWKVFRPREVALSSTPVLLILIDHIRNLNSTL